MLRIDHITAVVLASLLSYAVMLVWRPRSLGRAYLRAAIVEISLFLAGLFTAIVTVDLVARLRQEEIGLMFVIIPAYCFVTLFQELPEFFNAKNNWEKFRDEQEKKRRKIKDAVNDGKKK